MIAALGLMGPSSMVSADDDFACAPEGKMKKVQLTAFSMEGTLCSWFMLIFIYLCSLPSRYLFDPLHVIDSLISLHSIHLINRPTLYHVRRRD